MKPTARLAVGFDLDMTLIDTVPGFAPTLEALGEELGVEFDVASMTSRLGPPLDVMMAGVLEPDRIPAAVDAAAPTLSDERRANVAELVRLGREYLDLDPAGTAGTFEAWLITTRRVSGRIADRTSSGEM